MNAIQPSRLTRQPLETRRRMVPRTSRRQRNQGVRLVACETTAKLVVNLVVCTAALTGLVKLLPYHLSQQTKLHEVRTEVKRTEARVNHIRADFSRSFDPGQAKSVMQEQSYRIDPTQRQVIWQEPKAMQEN